MVLNTLSTGDTFPSGTGTVLRMDAKPAASIPPAASPFDPVALRPRLIRLAVRLVWNRDDAEDAVQEAYRLLLDRGGQTIERPAAWLWRCVCQLCLNVRRRRRAASLDEAEPNAPPGDPGASLARTESLDALRDAIAELPDQRRVALLLRVMEEMSYDEVAEIMQLSTGAVRAHVHLAREELARRLEGPDGTP